MTSPLAAFYNEQGKYVGILGMGSVEEIFDRLTKAIKSFA
jgi:adenylate kinase family enzyme